MSRRIFTSKGERQMPKTAKLVGTRIDPTTEVGKDLAGVRKMFDDYAAAMEGAPDPRDPDNTLDRLNRSLNTTLQQRVLNNDVQADQRKRLIRKRIQDALDTAFAVHGRYPKSIGVPAETYEEVKLACSDMDVQITREKP